jgi:hypothetical protein
MFVPGENPGLDKALEKLWLASRQMVWPLAILLTHGD